MGFFDALSNISKSLSRSPVSSTDYTNYEPLGDPLYNPMSNGMQEAVDHIEKSTRSRDSIALVADPQSLGSGMGYKERPSTINFETLQRVSIRNSVVAAVIVTRVNQVSSFSSPARFSKDGVGFEISLKDPKKKPTPEQERLMLALESFLENCGYDNNPNRDNFDDFLRKIVRDSLTYDQLTFEKVPDRLGRIAEFYAVDAGTIRSVDLESLNEDDQLVYSELYGMNNLPRWVQVINGVVTAEFTGKELAFGVRNPRTDINSQPYGLSEIEILTTQITSHLWAEDYNSRYFSQGGTTKGILNLKGQNLSKEQIEAFRRQWNAQITGMTGAWKTPVMSVDGIEYLNVSQSNREMEYEMWMNYLINIVTSVYQIDPSEVNFPNRGGAGGGGGGGLGDGGIEDRLKNSKDKGLRPLLRFIENTVNRHLISEFSTDFTFKFVGLDRESEKDKQELTNKEVRMYKTVNEVRKEHDMKPIKGGDIILDPTFSNYLSQQEMAEQAEQAPPEEEGQEEEQPTDEVDTGQDGVDDEQLSQTIDERYS